MARLGAAVAAAIAAAVVTLSLVETGSSESAHGAACPVTLPRKLPPAPRAAGFANPEFNDGNSYLRVILWPHGVLIAGILPDGGSMAEILRDGSISAKQAWWRGLPDRLRGRKLVVSGRRLDAPAPPMRADVPDGYGSLGVQPTGPRFPTTGCWRVTGRQGRVSLSFVVRVVKLHGA